MDRTVSFGYWIKRRRKALDLTQEELARRVGCAVDTIKKIEADARRPSKQLAELLAAQLQVPSQERTVFIQAARAERTSERLEIESQPLQATAPDPPFLAATHAAPSEPSVFVGRARELEMLHAHLDQARKRQGRVVFVTGEAGRGKTALLAEFARQAQAAHPDLIVASGNCYAVGGIGDPHLPFRDVMCMLSGDVESKWAVGALSREQAQRLWHLAPETAQALVEEGPDLIDMFVSGAAMLKRTMGRASEGAEWLKRLQMLTQRERARSGDLQQALLFEQYTNVLQRLASNRPLLLIVDNMQWADDASINLLFHLGRRITDSQILIVGVYRLSDVALGRLPMVAGQERTHPLKPVVAELKRHFGEIQIDLGWETRAEGRAFVDELLDRAPNDLSESFRATLFARTQGHPLFTVELLRDLEARGDLVRDKQGRVTARSELNWDALPARVEAVMEQRIGRLSPELRELLRVACVEGEGFCIQVLAQVTGKDESQVLRWVAEELEQRHRLVRARDEVWIGQQLLSRYWFGHTLFQQYLYQQLKPGERRLLHSQVGGALEGLCAEGLDGVAVLLERHFTEAGELDKTVHYLVRAGDRARMQYAHQEAVEHYERALHILKANGDDERAAQTLMKLAQAHNIGFDFERARGVYQEGFALWQRVEANRFAMPLPPAPHPLRMMWREPESLDPTLGGLNMTAPLTSQLFSGLVAHSPDTEVIPDVARSWEILEGGAKYVFHLRGDVFWSDGARVTAHDFEFTFKRALDPKTKTPVAGLLLHSIKAARDYHEGRLSDANAVGVRAVDDATLVIELEVPSSYFIQDLSYYVLLPTPRHVIERFGAAWAEPENIVTNGPFRLAAWQRGESMLLERNPRYHGSRNGNVEQVWLALNVSTGDHFEWYHAAKLDVVYNWFFPAVEMDALRRRHPEEHFCRPRFQPFYLVMNVTRPPFDDVRVRRAFAMAIDKMTFAQLIDKGYGLAATGGFIPPGMPGHSPGIGLPFAPEEARQLLAEAGYANISQFPQVSCYGYRTRSVTTEFLQQQWRDNLGIETKIEHLDPSDYAERIKREEPQIIVGGWWADYADPDNFLRVDVQLDAPEWRHLEYENLLERTRSIADQTERMNLYQRADHILMEQAVIVPLNYVQSHLLLKPWVRQFPIELIKGPGFWKDVIIEPHA